MGDRTEEEGALLASTMQQVPMPDWSKINPALIGKDPAITAAYEKYNQSIEKYADELEKRYEQPNWFKVAAGFAKPQLGGFLASAGSASQELGKWVEQQRSIAPTVAEMRSRIAAGQLGLLQGKTASDIALAAAASPTGTATPGQQTTAALLNPEAGRAITTGQAMQTAQFDNLVRALESGMSYTQLIAKYGLSFVNNNLSDALSKVSNFSNVSPDVPRYSVVPPVVRAPAPVTETTGAPKAGAETAKPEAPVIGSGVPQSSISQLPFASQIQQKEQAATKRQELYAKTSQDLASQADAGQQVFEVAKNVYQVGAKPGIANAFGVFKGGDPFSMIGRALEQQQVSSVMQNMRDQVIQSRLSDDKKNSALSDLDSFESVLADLQLKIQNGIINPTDARTMFEAKSVPGKVITRDAFLRNVARIGSDALLKHEKQLAFSNASNPSKNPNFDIYNWTSSPEHIGAVENASKRNRELTSNVASEELPKFFRDGLSGAYVYTKPKAGATPATPTRPDERLFNGQIYVRQSDGSYKLKGQP